MRKTNDPIKAGARKAKAQRRVGAAASCTACGESRPEALVTRSRPRLCEECYRKKRGMKTTDAHHIAGKKNSPITIKVPANDHRASLSTAQYDWPPKTLENVDGSPILRASAALRGGCDIVVELFARLVLACAEFLERVDVFLREKLGETWWAGSEFADWQP